MPAMRRTLILVALTSASALAFANNTHQNDRDDPRERFLATDHLSPAEIKQRDAAALLESRKIAAQQARLRIGRPLNGTGAWANAAVAGTSWVSLGPTDALQEFNGSSIAGVDSGRPSGIIVDPRDPNIVYVATSGGGVWKTFNFLTAINPTWQPLTDTQPNIAIGAMAMDPAAPNTIYIGMGDAFDLGGNTVQKSTDGGITWSTPVVLSGTYPAPINLAVTSGSVRDIAVRGNTVFVASSVGLFKSADAGATFALVPLPTNPANLTQAMWSIAYVGGTHWLVSGVQACDTTPAAANVPPGVIPLPTGNPFGNCTNGTEGAIWLSTDGTNWTMQTTPLANGFSRVTLAAGATTNPATTVVYAWVGNDWPPTGAGLPTDNGTIAFWRSDDGGATWNDATGTLRNPTLVYPTGGGGFGADCFDLDVGHEQDWYNQVIQVDPTNPANVYIGGNLCGARTLNGTAVSPVWENVSHWLPSGGGGITSNGNLPYVHADWHASTVSAVGGTVRAFAGTDGGVFASTNLFDPATPGEKVVWTNYNKGLATHLEYNIASGDPADGNQFTVFSGLQDNGTRYRSQTATPAAYNQVIGGDGIGAVVHNKGAAQTYFGSVEFGTLFCVPNGVLTDCNAYFNWNQYPFVPDPTKTSDSLPFLVGYANAEIDPTGLPADGSLPVLTFSGGGNAGTGAFIWYAGCRGTGCAGAPPANGPVWKRISQDLNAAMGGGTAPNIATNVTVARGVKDLFGAVLNLSRAPFAWIDNSVVTNQLKITSTWNITQPVHPKGGAVRLIGPSTIDFPPYVPTGKTPGQVFIGGFSRSNMSDGTLVTAAQGHLYRTLDGGATWASIAGADVNHQLPNVPIHVVKYDPTSTELATTIYVGTDIGMYVSNDNGTTWDRYGFGLPMVRVLDIYVSRAHELIRIATYGRGMWEIYPNATANHGADGNGDYDRNQQLDWVDLAALASRLGNTPATAVAPLYSWIDDLTGAGATPPVQSIDDADLQALLANFGGNP
jgi:hypothetical protein